MATFMQGLLTVFLYTVWLDLGAYCACVDDPTFDCAHIATAFDVCADVTHARAVCRKFCNLCEDPCDDDPSFNCSHISSVFNICSDVTHAKKVCPKFCNLCSSDHVRDCKDALDQHAASVDGHDTFRIQIGANRQSEIVRCDMTTDGGGWTVLMNRESGTVNFSRNSVDYALGFGSLDQNFWIGLETMHTMTSDGRRYQLRVEIARANGQRYYEIYDDFSVGPRPQFVLHLAASRGTAGNSLARHSGYGFSTYDVDRDNNTHTSCAKYLGGAWWFHDCYDSCLTCPYETPGSIQCRSMSWNTVHYCEALKSSRMMVRPM